MTSAPPTFVSSSAIRPSTKLCRSRAAWYSAFSERSPWARASAIALVMAWRSTRFKRSSSSFSFSYPPRVIGVRWTAIELPYHAPSQPRRDVGLKWTSTFAFTRAALSQDSHAWLCFCASTSFVTVARLGLRLLAPDRERHPVFDLGERRDARGDRRDRLEQHEPGGSLHRRRHAPLGQVERRLLERVGRADAGEAVRAGDGGLDGREAQRLRLGREVLRGQEPSPDRLGAGLHRLLGRLGLEPAPNLPGDVPQRLLAARADVQDPDRVEAEGRAHGLGRHLALLQREERLLELRDQFPRADPAEVAALRRGAGILGGLLGELGEVLAGLGAPDDIGDLGPRAVLRLTAAGLGHARQHVRGVDAARLLELLRVLAVVLLHRGVRHGLEEVLGGERHGEDPASLGLPELVLMRAQVLPELVVARRRRGDERPELDQRPGRARSEERRVGKE